MTILVCVRRVVIGVAQVLLLVGMCLAMTGCSGSPTSPSSQSSVVVPMPGPSVPPGTQSFWVDVRPNPIVMSVGREASIQIEGSFDWYDLVVRVEPVDAFRIQMWGINIVNLTVLRRTTGTMTVEAYGSGNRLAKATATISVP